MHVLSVDAFKEPAFIPKQNMAMDWRRGKKKKLIKCSIKKLIHQLTILRVAPNDDPNVSHLPPKG